ncbi:MAG: hypothetical protein WEB57_06885 [Pseudohongiellaceae bacterium]
MMKSHSWDELNDSARDFFDSIGMLPESGVEEDINDKRLQRRRLTELRRRTEERLDWRRAYGDLQFDDLDHLEGYDDGPGFSRQYHFDELSDSSEFDEH